MCMGEPFKRRAALLERPVVSSIVRVIRSELFGTRSNQPMLPNERTIATKNRTSCRAGEHCCLVDDRRALVNRPSLHIGLLPCRTSAIFSSHAVMRAESM